MSENKTTPRFGLSAEEKSKLISNMRLRAPEGDQSSQARLESRRELDIPDHLCDFSQIPGYKKLHIHRAIASQAGIMTPYFLCHDTVAKDVTYIQGKKYLNFSTYDYIDLNGSERLNEAARQAMEKYGTSASASRLVSGERPPHRELEGSIANFFGVEDCIVFVSGHATNVWTIAQLFSRNDLVVYDALSHNSIIQGALISGAQRLSFPHNDYEALEKLLLAHRANYKRAVIVAEGLYSMDGDMPELPQLVELKKRFKCFLMVDEAHALGVVGRTGRGVAEHFGVPGTDVDIWMGTLSKTLCGCGGFIAGSKPLVEYLKFTSPGFVYSVGLAPPLAAASNEALKILLEEPERVARLQANGRYFLEYARKKGFDTGNSQGYSIVPLIVGNSLVAGLLSSSMFQRGINVMPIIYPVVEDSCARLRFFLSAAHKEEQIRQALDICAEELPRVQSLAESYSEEYLNK